MLPLLFSLFTSQLSFSLDEIITAIFYVDDLVIVSEILQDLRHSLNRIKIFGDEHDLSVIASKTKTMKIRSGGPLCKTDKLFYNNHEIDFVNSFSYLGVQISTGNTRTKHFQMFYKKGLKAVNILGSELDFSKNNFYSAERLVNAVILPASTYGVSTFGYDKQKSPEFVENAEN